MTTKPNRRKRVLVIVQNLSVPRDRRVWLECQALVTAGYEVSVICPRGDDPANSKKHERLAGVDIFRYKAPPTTESAVSFFYEFAYCWVRTALLSVKVARRRGFEVIQACNPPDTFWLLALMWRVAGKRFVFDQHDLNPETYEARFGKRGPLHRALSLLERATYRTADHVIATNESYKEVAMRRGKLDDADVTVVRTGPDPLKMRRREPDPSLSRGRKYLAVYLGVMGPQDGVDLAVRAADHLVHNRGRTDITFVLLGSGDSLASLRSLTTELGLDDYVFLPGYTPDDSVFTHLSTADVGLGPDPLNPLNDVSTMNKTMEYMAFGLPVVAFDLKETRVSAGDAAAYATPNDVAEFGDLLAELLEDPDRRQKMGEFGRARVEDHLAWEHQAPNYLGVYERVIGLPA